MHSRRKNAAVSYSLRHAARAELSCAVSLHLNAALIRLSILRTLPTSTGFSINNLDVEVGEQRIGAMGQDLATLGPDHTLSGGHIGWPALGRVANAQR